MGKIRVGTSGYSFESWKGHVYPTHLKTTEMFGYYVNQFRLNTVEINYTYYRLPTARGFDYYAKRSPDGFDFAVKLFGGITHEPWKNSSSSQLCNRFIEGIRPLIESKKLGCILAQFPPDLRPSRKSWDLLYALQEALGGLPLVYEFRNRAWATAETVETLKQAGIGFCTVDAPQIGSLMPFVPAVTSDIAYLRLHGRNPMWFADPSQRYDHLYSNDELENLLPEICSMASQCRTMYIQFNNCHAGAAVKNVQMIMYLLGIDCQPIQRSLI